MESSENKRGGRREGAGRPKNDRNIMVGVRLSQEAADKLNRLTRNKSEYIERLIREQSESERPVERLFNGKVVEHYRSAAEAERKGFQRRLIAKCCNGKRKHHGGYEWKYAD